MDPVEAAHILFGAATPGSEGRVIFKKPDAIWDMVPPASELRLAERYMGGEPELEVLEQVARWQGPQMSWRLARRTADGRALGVPSTRATWFEQDPFASAHGRQEGAVHAAEV